MVNGFTSDDNWAFTYTVIMDRGDSRRFQLTLPKEEELISLKIRPSKIYHPISKINIYFDDDPTPITADIPVRGKPGRRRHSDIPAEKQKPSLWKLPSGPSVAPKTSSLLIICGYRSNAPTNICNALIHWLNIGALMVYERGQGGIVLNQIKILDQEQNPDNTQKKSNDCAHGS